jgi:hypothetical protein
VGGQGVVDRVSLCLRGRREQGARRTGGGQLGVTRGVSKLKKGSGRGSGKGWAGAVAVAQQHDQVTGGQGVVYGVGLCV